MSRFVAFAIAVLVCTSPANGATFTVDTGLDLVDESPVDGVCQTAGGLCSLRAAVQQANATVGKDTVSIPAGTYVLSIAGDGEDEAATGDIDIRGAVSIVGAGPGVTIVDANGIDRIFDLLSDDGEGVEIAGLEMKNGAPGSSFSYGGGMFVDVEVTLTMTDVSIHDCEADHGGGLYNEIGAALVLTRTSITSNTAPTAGGGIESLGGADLLNVTVGGNLGGVSSGIANVGDLVLGNVTFVGNRLVSEGQTTVKNSIFANSPCPMSGVASLGYNIDDGTTCPFSALGDLSNVDPMLGPLQDNGGGTLTYAIGAGSPAIDAGSPDCPPPSEDQRGEVRPVDGDQNTTAVCDIGAYEYDPTVSPTSTTTTIPGGTTTTTTLPPMCAVAPTFASAECRLGDLATRLEQVGTAGKRLDRLAKLLTKAGTKLTVAQEKLALEKPKPARKQVRKARRFVKRFGKKVGSKKGAKVVVDETDRLDLQVSAVGLEADLLVLADSLL